MKQQTDNTGTEGKHTTGDWVRDGFFIVGGINKETYDGQKGRIVCDLCPETEYEYVHPVLNEEEFNANAKLIASAPTLKSENEKLREQNRVLLGIAKQVAFVFGNEANYPEGTMGYRMAKEATEAINKAKNK